MNALISYMVFDFKLDGFLVVADWRSTMWASFVPIVEGEEEEEEEQAWEGAQNPPPQNKGSHSSSCNVGQGLRVFISPKSHDHLIILCPILLVSLEAWCFYFVL